MSENFIDLKTLLTPPASQSWFLPLVCSHRILTACASLDAFLPGCCSEPSAPVGTFPGRLLPLQGPELVPAGRPAYCWINTWLQKLWLIIAVFAKCCLRMKLTLLVTSQMPKVKTIYSLVLGGYLLDMVLLMRHGAAFSPTRVANSFTEILVFV